MWGAAHSGYSSHRAALSPTIALHPPAPMGVSTSPAPAPPRPPACRQTHSSVDACQLGAGRKRATSSRCGACWFSLHASAPAASMRAASRVRGLGGRVGSSGELGRPDDSQWRWPSRCADVTAGLRAAGPERAPSSPKPSSGEARRRAGEHHRSLIVHARTRDLAHEPRGQPDAPPHPAGVRRPRARAVVGRAVVDAGAHDGQAERDVHRSPKPPSFIGMVAWSWYIATTPSHRPRDREAERALGGDGPVERRARCATARSRARARGDARGDARSLLAPEQAPLARVRVQRRDGDATARRLDRAREQPGEPVGGARDGARA